MRWVIRGFGLGVILVGFACLGAWYLVQRSLPNYDAELRVPVITAPVEIARTREAVPHVFGATDADIYFGLGYAHAEDRFWQMEVLRRTAQGRLSEMLGPAVVDADELLRRMGLYRAAESSVSVQAPYTRAALDAYAAGVNARLAATPGWGGPAPEFLLFPIEIEPWRPADSLAILKLTALQLASHVDREVLRARVAAVVSPERLADILPDDPNTGIVTSPRDASLYPVYRDGPVETAALPGFLMGPFSSNAWAAGPSRSATGLPLLANDPHLDLVAPSVLYLARLELSTGAAIGGTIPGIPSVLTGRRADLAWGVTAANMDDQDVYFERLNPDNPNEVLTPDGYMPLRVERETIRVRGGDPVEIELKWSENGPVIPGKYYNLTTVTPAGHVAVIARTLFDPADTSLSAGHRLMKARSIEEAMDAVEDFVTPAQNLTLADSKGVALQMIGRMPRRLEGHSTLGRMPSEGWIAANRWRGTLGYHDNPRFADPVEGIVGNTNNKTVDRPFPFHVSYDWGDIQRILRWEELMAAQDLHDMESFMAAQLDPVSLPAKRLLPILEEVLGPVTGSSGEAMALLTGWDAAMLEDRPEPLIYAAWMQALQPHLIKDELGELAEAFTHPNPVFLERVLSDENGASVWCDDVSTPAVENCAETAGTALDIAIERLAESPGGALSVLRWGDVHQATHDHPVLGGLPVIGAFVNIRQSTSGGDHTMMRGLTYGTGDEPLRNKHGSVFRSIIDMADPESSVFVISTGQSGHPLSRHYRDQAELWRDGRYLSMSLDPAAIHSNAQAITRLLPE